MVLEEGHVWIAEYPYSQHYAVSADGFVWSYKNYPNPPVKLKGGINGKYKEDHPMYKYRKDGQYPCVCLTHEGKSKSFTVHRLIAKAFIPNPENLPCVNHKDCNKLNNDVSNLEWVTYSENTKHMYDNGLNSMSPEFKAEWRAKRVKAVLGEETGYKSKVKFLDVPADVFEEAGVPYEIRDLVKSGGSPLEYWNKICTMFDLIDDGLSYIKTAQVMNLSLSGVSRLARGIRNEKSREIYDKYGKMPEYRKNYKFWSKE